ncbi:hypothetical protein GGI1_19464 [Acidithiobacillus sp. GGI-221]|nr:hypothetical protein GGI1_19464 [Acidithiobacillus sp. GGI-221]
MRFQSFGQHLFQEVVLGMAEKEIPVIRCCDAQNFWFAHQKPKEIPSCKALAITR